MSEIRIDPEDTIDIRLLEHLTSFAWNVLDAHRDGSLDLAQAKLQVAQELQRCNAGSFLLEDAVVCTWMRLSWADDKGTALQLIERLQEQCKGELLTVRWLGPRREEDEPIAWVTVGFENVADFITTVAGLEKAGVVVRDANFGGVVL